MPPPAQPGPEPANNPKADAKAAKAYAKASRAWYQKKRFWLLGVIVLIVIIPAVSSGGADDSTDSASDSSQSEDSEPKSNDSDDDAKPKEPKEPKEKSIKVGATQIIKDFEDNEAAADGKYKGKTLEVSGVVAKIDTELFDDEEYVVQIGGGGDFEFITVNCDDQASEDVSSLKKGDDITVVGDFEDGGDLGVELKNCTIQ